MVYTAALLFGHGLPGLSEESSVVDMIERCFFPKNATSTGDKTAMMPPEGRTTRRGSVESYEDSDNHSLCGAASDAPPEDEQLLLQQLSVLRSQLELCLTAGKSSALRCRALLLPRHMTSRVARDVVRASADEPCGLRGACVSVYVDTEDGLRSLGALSPPDPSVTPTFELSVEFKTERGGGPLQRVFHQGGAVKLRPQYRLVKRKLYSSASPVIHDFN